MLGKDPNSVGELLSRIYGRDERLDFVIRGYAPHSARARRETRDDLIDLAKTLPRGLGEEVVAIAKKIPW